MKAIILAAGTGKRLGKLTESIPKCLLPIIGEDTVIDLSLKSLQANNILEIIFVTGYKEERLREHINNKKWKNKLTFRFVFNDKYKEYNNIYSAYQAKDLWDDETLLLNSDIIYHPLILKNLIQEIKKYNKQKSFLIIDDIKQLTEESMKVKLNSFGEIKEIRKELEIEKSFGEYIGIAYLRGFERVKFLKSLENNVRNNKLDLYYEDAIAHILNEISVSPFSTSGKQWTEIDTIEDYESAKKLHLK